MTWQIPIKQFHMRSQPSINRQKRLHIIHIKQNIKYNSNVFKMTDLKYKNINANKIYIKNIQGHNLKKQSMSTIATKELLPAKKNEHCQSICLNNIHRAKFVRMRALPDLVIPVLEL